MGKDPAVLFYTSDFLTGTSTMENDHVGMYIRLLCLQHQKGVLTEKDMLYICRTYVKDVYDKFTKKDGLYWNERMKDEAEKRRLYSESRRENVNKRYPKGKKKKATYVEHMENEDVDVDKYIKKWNDSIPTTVKKLSSERRNHLLARIKEKEFSDNYDLIIKKILESDFLMGKNGRDDSHKGWKVNFDWLVKNDGNYIKVLEGKYDGHKQITRGDV